MHAFITVCFGALLISFNSYQIIVFHLQRDCLVYRVELKGNKYVLGDFLEFKGKREDVDALRHIRRSKVSRVVIQKTSMFGLGNLFGNKLWLCFSSLYLFA